MRAGHRWLLAFSLALIVTGLVGIATLSPAGDHHQRQAGQPDHPAAAGGAVPGGAVPGGAAGPSALAAQLLGPTDLRGFAPGSASGAEADLGSAPCLLGLGPSSFQTGRVVAVLRGPGPGGLPAVAEVLAAYPAAAAAPVFASVAAALQACPAFSMTVAGTSMGVPLDAASMAVVGDASRLYEGRFRVDGRMEQLDVALVLDRSEVLGLVYVEAVPLSGGLISTVRAAVAKLA